MRTVIIVGFMLAISSALGAQDSPQGATSSPPSPGTAAQREGNEAVLSLRPGLCRQAHGSTSRQWRMGSTTISPRASKKKLVPVVLVSLREKADFEKMTGVSETDRAGWARILFWGNDNTDETASVKLVHIESGDMVFAYSVKKTSSARGKQSAGESIAKHIKEKIEGR